MTMRRIVFLMTILSPVLQACGTATIEDAVPMGALQPGGAPAAQQAVFVQPGQFPNLNVIPSPATSQLTPDEVSAKTEELRARRQRIASGGGSSIDETATLRRIGGQHADSALREIEGR
jgi:hypothetical protein